MKNVSIRMGETVQVTAVPDSEVPAKALAVVNAYFELANSCLQHTEECNIHTRERPGKGCDCPFGAFSGAVFALDRELRKRGVK